MPNTINEDFQIKFPCTTSELIQSGTKILAQAGIENPRFESEILLSDLLSYERLQLITCTKPIFEDLGNKYFTRINERKNGKPSAYILGYKYFYNQKFLVSQDVLIPRPETEYLVEVTLNENFVSGSRILDLCTGSGCVGLSIFMERPDLLVDLSDISEDALNVARANARELNISNNDNINFFASNLYVNLPSVLYDAILCNPPYIHPDEKETLSESVHNFEPHLALFDSDPELLYSKIISGAADRLSANGILLMELSPRWSFSVLKQAKQHFVFAEIRKDISAKERYIFARGIRIDN